ncbi:MAG: DegQ family serine endoprotease [Betaproteobacteria bacterium]|nr:MAG: DegQ family serine endoprotease [Betaproteobacteria bacterium]
MKLRIWTTLGALVGVLWFSPAVPAQVGKGLPDFTELYEQQGPAVVSIDVTQKSRRSVMPELSEDDPFYEFFRRFGQIPRNTPRPRDFEQQSTGSGFILSADGYILTNAHVVDEASEVSVKLTDKREFKAKVIGTDKRTDVALLKIEATGLPKVTIGDPEKLKVGEWVAAIGKPFGLENTITAGIVSAKGRELPNENLVSYIQTDVPINPGNSGGPLFNLKGEVVGVNSMIYSRTGGSMGLAFAIPIDVAINVTKQIQEKGRVTRSRIGVQIQEVSRETADAFGLAKANGALVNSVEKGGPADKAGIEQGDIIVKADGRNVSSSAELPRIITAVKPGTRIVLQVWHKGAVKDVNVTVAELKEDEGARPARRPAPGKDKEKAKPNRMGLVLSDLSEEQKKELEIKSGVGVEEISGTARGDIQPGDVILALISRGTTIEAKSAEQLNAQIAKAEKGSSVTFLLKRGERQFYSTIKLGNGGE